MGGIFNALPPKVSWYSGDGGAVPRRPGGGVSLPNAIQYYYDGAWTQDMFLDYISNLGDGGEESGEDDNTIPQLPQDVLNLIKEFPGLTDWILDLYLEGFWK